MIKLKETCVRVYNFHELMQKLNIIWNMFWTSQKCDKCSVETILTNTNKDVLITLFRGPRALGWDFSVFSSKKRIFKTWLLHNITYSMNPILITLFLAEKWLFVLFCCKTLSVAHCMRKKKRKKQQKKLCPILAYLF